MKRLKVVVGAEADRDLLQIYRRVYEASRDPHVAKRFLNRITARCQRIGDAPHGGVEADHVPITNVFYGGRDDEALYREPPERES